MMNKTFGNANAEILQRATRIFKSGQFLPITLETTKTGRNIAYITVLLLCLLIIS